MAEEMRQGYCQTCQQYGPVTRKGINHILHLILTLVTFGTWLFVWLALALLKVGGWRCKRCGGDSVDQVGELFSLKGWILLVLVTTMLTIIDPEAFSAFSGFVMLFSIPVFVIGARRQSKRREEGVRKQTQAEKERGATGDGPSFEVRTDRPGELSIGLAGGPSHGRAESVKWEERDDYFRKRAGDNTLLATFDPPVAVAFDYQGMADDDPQPRDVDVTQLVKRGDKLYLQGWCQLRDDERMFRTDRMDGVVVKATGESLGLQILHTPARLQMALMAANVL